MWLNYCPKKCDKGYDKSSQRAHEKDTIVQAKFMPQSGTKLNPEGREQDDEALEDEARDLRLSLDLPSSQGETTEEF